MTESLTESPLLTVADATAAAIAVASGRSKSALSFHCSPKST